MGVDGFATPAKFDRSAMQAGGSAIVSPPNARSHACCGRREKGACRPPTLFVVAVAAMAMSGADTDLCAAVALGPDALDGGLRVRDLLG